MYVDADFQYKDLYDDDNETFWTNYIFEYQTLFINIYADQDFQDDPEKSLIDWMGNRWGDV